MGVLVKDWILSLGPCLPDMSHDEVSICQFLCLVLYSAINCKENIMPANNKNYRLAPPVNKTHMRTSRMKVRIDALSPLTLPLTGYRSVTIVSELQWLSDHTDASSSCNRSIRRVPFILWAGSCEWCPWWFRCQWLGGHVTSVSLAELSVAFWKSSRNILPVASLVLMKWPPFSL